MKTQRLSQEITLLLGSIGAAQAFFLALQSLLGKGRHKTSLLLGFLFLCLTLRIVKSLLWVYLDTLPEWAINIGFATHAATGPLLLLYTWHFLGDRRWKPASYLHFLPALLLLTALGQLSLDGFWYQGGYSALLYHQLAYSLAAAGVLVMAWQGRDKTNGLPKRDWLWIAILVLGILLLQAAYFSNYILGLTPYLLGPVVYAVFVYFLSFLLLQHPRVPGGQPPPPKYGHINLHPAELDAYRNQVKELFNNQKPYLDSGYTLNRMAADLRMPPYLLSHVINKGFNRHFSDFLNAYRIDEARALLRQPRGHKLKIASIAYECGFNSLSAFNKAFKRHSGNTPSGYRAQVDL